MIDGLSPYPRMRDSGLSWLGAIPEHWRLFPNRTVFQEIKKRGTDGEELLSVTISRGVIPQAELLASTSKKDSSNLDKSKYKLVEPGDLVYNKMRAWQGALGVSPVRGIVSPAYIVQRLRADGLPRYFHYLFRTPAFAAEAERWSYGITSDQWSLRPEHFKMIYSCLPELEEQIAIVRFLDAGERQVGELVRKKRQIVALLSEEIQAITDLFIGTGPKQDAPRRATGTRWLKEVPAHWELKRLQHLLDPAIPLAYGILLPGPQLDEGAPYIGAGDVKPERLRLDALPRTTQEISDAYPRTKMRAGEIVYAIRGSFGRAEVLPTELEGLNLSRDAARLAPRNGVNPSWLVLALRSGICQRQFSFREIGATITGVNIRDLKRVIVPVPPEDEQAAIVRHLDEATADPLRAIDTAEREMRLIGEYLIRIRSDVVTGKLDVREAVKRLAPDTRAPDGEVAAGLDAGRDETDLVATLEEVSA